MLPEQADTRLTGTVIAEMLGMLAEDIDRFRALVQRHRRWIV